VRALAVAPAGGLVATGDEKGCLRLWDATTGVVNVDDLSD
jgi:hypothetical protein